MVDSNRPRKTVHVEVQRAQVHCFLEADLANQFLPDQVPPLRYPLARIPNTAMSSRFPLWSLWPLRIEEGDTIYFAR
jgi:hypothetical protein